MIFLQKYNLSVIQSTLKYDLSVARVIKKKSSWETKPKTKEGN